MILDNTKMKLNGIQLAVIELLGFYHISHLVKLHSQLVSLPIIPYYWITFTIMTGIWETFYLCYREKVKTISHQLERNREHVWTNYYSPIKLIPSDFSLIFYSEYGAYADREYIRLRDNWSLDIEGTHALFCGLTSLIGILTKLLNGPQWLIWITISMSCQLMNSVLYLGQYFIQIKSPDSVNFDTPFFPCGPYLLKRPFMYINIFWTIMPLYILFKILFFSNLYDQIL